MATPAAVPAGASTTLYWKSQKRKTLARDIGHKCRECGAPFAKVGDGLVMRRGGRIELRYHAACFSGSDDPRSQPSSSFSAAEQKRLKVSLPDAAPQLPFRKMRTSSQF
jgi:hypothetical protein